MDNFNILRQKFEQIKKKGWIKSCRRGYTGIGYTFEKLIGKKEDALCSPDYNGIEIKTHRKNSNSYVTLFNYNPVGDCSYELRRLFNNYSYVHTKNKNIRALNAEIYCNYIKDVGINYKFSLEVADGEQKIYLLVFDRLGFLVEKKAYWTFETLKEKLYKKMKYLAYIEADSKYINGFEYFKYNNINFYVLKDFDTFIDLIKNAKIKVSFLVSGLLGNDETINSHGTSFSIKKENLHLLFNPISHATGVEQLGKGDNKIKKAYI